MVVQTFPDIGLIRLDGTITGLDPVNLADHPEIKAAFPEGFCFGRNGFSFCATVCKNSVTERETPSDLSRVFSFAPVRTALSPSHIPLQCSR